MTGVDPMDVCLKENAKTLDLRIDPHPQASMLPEDLKELRRAFHFLMSVAVTLELKMRSYKGFDIEKYMERYMKSKYLAYLDKAKESAVPFIEGKRLQYNLDSGFPFFVRSHLERFYKEKAVTMEESPGFQTLNLCAYYHVSGEYADIYFEESDISVILREYDYNDKYFNPVITKTEAEPDTPQKQTALSNTVDLKEQPAEETLKG